MQIDDVMLSQAKHLLFRPVENKSRFFSPAKSAGLQNDIILHFSAACSAAEVAGPQALKRAVNSIVNDTAEAIHLRLTAPETEDYEAA